MTWSSPRTWIDTETITAALLNSSIRDLFLELWKFAAKGDLAVAQSGAVINRLAVGSNGQALVADSAQTLGVKWSTGPVIPVGGIILWSGSVAGIPSGWALCNGSNGTPDLRERFVIGTNEPFYPPGTTGGGLTANMLHRHDLYGSTGAAVAGGSGVFATGGTQGHTHSLPGTTEYINISVDIRPPYYALAYIMRIS